MLVPIPVGNSSLLARFSSSKKEEEEKKEVVRAVLFLKKPEVSVVHRLHAAQWEIQLCSSMVSTRVPIRPKFFPVNLADYLPTNWLRALILFLR